MEFSLTIFSATWKDIPVLKLQKLKKWRIKPYFFVFQIGIRLDSMQCDTTYDSRLSSMYWGD